MHSEADAASIEQRASRHAIGDGVSQSHRLLLWAQTDIWGLGELSTIRRLAAWVALGVTVAIAMLLAMGY